MRDQDTIRRFDLLELSGEDYWVIAKNGMAIAVLVYIISAMIAQGTPAPGLAFVVIPPILGLLYSLWMIWLANGRLNPAQRERLTRQRDLMAERTRMQVASARAAEDRNATLAHMARLRDLISRMIKLDDDQLADRISRLKELYKRLDDRERANRRLMARYDCECELLILEMDALDVLPEDAEAALGARLAELEALEEQLESGQRRRSAEEELDRFLEGVGS